MAGTTILKPTFNSSSPTPVAWSAFTSGDADNYYDVGQVEGTRVILLVASESTNVTAGTTVYIGTSDSATTRSAAAALYSGAVLNRMKIKLAKQAKASAYAKFRTTGTTRLLAINALGPFETARFTDSNNHVNFAKAITGSTIAWVSAILV